MILWNKAPIAAICRVMPVVSHHPIVVKFERIAARRLTINIDFSILNLQVIILIHLDTALINRQILQCKVYALSLCRVDT